MSKLKDAETRIAELRTQKTAAATKMVATRKAFEESDADPTDPETPQFKAFDAAGKEHETLTEQLEKATRVYATLKGGELQGDPFKPDPTDKQAGDNFLDRYVETLKAASVGRRVSNTDAYKALKESGVFTSDAPVGSIELGKAYSRDEIKALVGLGNPTGGAGNLLTPDRLPLVNLVPQRPLRIVDLISKGTTDSKSIEYPVLIQRGMQAGYVKDPETAAPIDGTTVTPVQGGRKPETSLVWDLRTATVRTVATWIPVHRNMMDDAPYLESMIDAFLRDELDQRLEDDVVTGAGTGEVFRGILNTPGIGSQAIGLDSIIDAAHKAMTLVRLQYEEPTAFAINPSTWQTIRLLRDDSGAGVGTGGYLFGPPSQAGDTTLWGKPVVQTTAVPAGTVLTGDWSKAMLWFRTGVRVLASDSHEDYFTRNLVAILAELRAAFGVIKPLAFAKAT